jgi:hypothetical protein
MCQTLLLAELNHTVAILEPPNDTFAHKLNHSFISFVDELGNHFSGRQEFLGCDCVNPCEEEEEVRHKAATSIDMSGFMMRHLKLHRTQTSTNLTLGWSLNRVCIYIYIHNCCYCIVCSDISFVWMWLSSEE